MDQANIEREKKIWRIRILTATWFSYAGYYFCRKNYAIVKSSVQESLQITNSELAHIFTAYLIAYMLGQFLTGFLGRKVALRVLLLVSMGLTLLCNLVFGFSYLMGPAGIYPFLIFMIINGFVQSTGWPGNVGILSNWLSRTERGSIMAIWATSYQFGSLLAKAFAAYLLGLLGAAWSFWGAALVMFAVWILFLALQRDTPEEVGLPPIAEEPDGGGPAARTENRGDGPSSSAAASASSSNALKERFFSLFQGWTPNVIMTVIFMGAVYFVFKFLRYALDSWSPMAIEKIFHMSKDDAGYISILFDFVGFAGVLFAGWASDKFFAGKRHQMIVIMTCGMFAAFLFLQLFGMRSVVFFAIGLSLCGFMLMGPDSLLAGVGAIDVGGKNAVLAAGIINGIGSIGPIFQEEVIGWILDHYGYDKFFLLFVFMCAVGIAGAFYLSFRSRKGLSDL